MIKDELLLPIGRDLPVREIIGCFSMATANRRATKLSRILHLVHTYPGAPLLHKGLRFVTASLWSGYAALGWKARRESCRAPGSMLPVRSSGPPSAGTLPSSNGRRPGYAPRELWRFQHRLEMFRTQSFLESAGSA